LTEFSGPDTVPSGETSGGQIVSAGTVTRAQLSEAVYQEVGLSRNESADLVESILSEVADALARGEMVKISSFGSFAVRHKGERIGRNPKTGDEVPIEPRQVLVFRASHVLKDQINGALANGGGGKAGGDT
jgi:integration host factor subunit alpha